jgi:hypothetical protein
MSLPGRYPPLAHIETLEHAPPRRAKEPPLGARRGLDVASNPGHRTDQPAM